VAEAVGPEVHEAAATTVSVQVLSGELASDLDLAEEATTESIVIVEEDIPRSSHPSAKDHPSFAWLLFVPAAMFLFLSMFLAIIVKCWLKSRRFANDPDTTLTGTVSPHEDLEAAQPAIEATNEVDPTDYNDMCAILRMRLQ
jgi:hypothetical protein